MQDNAQADAPYKNADEITRQNCVDGIIDQLQQRGIEHLGNSLRGVPSDVGNCQYQLRRKQHAHSDGQKCSERRANEIHQDDRTHLSRMTGFAICKR